MRVVWEDMAASHFTFHSSPLHQFIFVWTLPLKVSRLDKKVSRNGEFPTFLGNLFQLLIIPSLKLVSWFNYSGFNCSHSVYWFIPFFSRLKSPLVSKTLSCAQSYTAIKSHLDHFVKLRQIVFLNSFASPVLTSFFYLISPDKHTNKMTKLIPVVFYWEFWKKQCLFTERLTRRDTLNSKTN